MKTGASIAVIGFLCVSGCANPGAKYAGAHPELSPAQREILVSGEIGDGAGVAGMTKEQVRLAMGAPKTVAMPNGQEVWVYESHSGFPFVGNSQVNPEDNVINMGDLGDKPMQTKTTRIFFQGERAADARISWD